MLEGARDGAHEAQGEAQISEKLLATGAKEFVSCLLSCWSLRNRQ